MQDSSEIKAFRNHGKGQAIVFVHGHMGDPIASWGRFPELILADPQLASWDVWSFGYKSSSAPDFFSFWNHLARLDELAILLNSRLTVSGPAICPKLALIARSDGGLIVQRALLDYPDLAARISHVFFLGTPSDGAKQANRVKFLQGRLADMAEHSDFIADLRQRWNAKFGEEVPFALRTIAGEEDAFVPIESSLLPFPRRYWLMVPGDHITISKPESDKSEVFVSIRNLLAGYNPPASVEKAVAGIAAMEPKIRAGEFDVFLCHNSEDKTEVRKIGSDLMKRGIRPWLDEEQIRPGTTWQSALEDQIQTIGSAAIFVGRAGIGPWQRMEQMALLDAFVKKGSPIIPVILPGAATTPELPLLLRNLHWVDFRRSDYNAMDQLVFGITGKHPEPEVISAATSTPPIRPLEPREGD